MLEFTYMYIEAAREIDKSSCHLMSSFLCEQAALMTRRDTRRLLLLYTRPMNGSRRLTPESVVLIFLIFASPHLPLYTPPSLSRGAKEQGVRGQTHNVVN